MRHVFLAAVFGFAFCTSNLCAQATPAKATVNVPFFVNDAHDTPISLFNAADIVVLDGKKPPQQIIGVRTRSELPLYIGILIDSSNSERASALYQAGVQAASDFINRVLVGNNDRIFVEQISTVPTATQLMSKAELLAYKFDLRPAGGTALYDGLALACNDRMQKDNVEPSLRAIVVLSDGGDNMSRIDSKQSITSAQRAGVVAFGVSTEDDDNLSGRGSQGNAFLKQLAEGTGGIAFLHLKRKDMARVFEKIQEQVGNMHLISYIPPDANLNSPYHPIELKSASGTKMKLRAPKGYYLTAKAQ